MVHRRMSIAPIVALGAYLLFSIKVVDQREKVAVLRLGRPESDVARNSAQKMSSASRARGRRLICHGTTTNHILWARPRLARLGNAYREALRDEVRPGCCWRR